MYVVQIEAINLDKPGEDKYLDSSRILAVAAYEHLRDHILGDKIAVYVRLTVRVITRNGYMISCTLIGSRKTKTLPTLRKD